MRDYQVPRTRPWPIPSEGLLQSRATTMTQERLEQPISLRTAKRTVSQLSWNNNTNSRSGCLSWWARKPFDCLSIAWTSGAIVPDMRRKTTVRVGIPVTSSEQHRAVCNFRSRRIRLCCFPDISDCASSFIQRYCDASSHVTSHLSPCESFSVTDIYLIRSHNQTSFV